MARDFRFVTVGSQPTVRPDELMWQGLAGNDYYVVQTTKAYYDDLMTKQLTYSDGSSMIYADTGVGDGIAAAIVACKGSRNDRIWVFPGTYTLAAAITLVGKSGVHLRALNGPFDDLGSTTSVYLIQGGNFANVIMSANSEITGFAIKNKAGYSAITVPANIFSGNIHHNWFMMVQGVACNIIDCTASVANKMGRIAHNRFNTEVSGNLTAAINCAAGYAQDVCFNEISFHSAGTVDYGIFNDSTGGMTNDNKVSGSNGVVITSAIAVSQYGSAMNNRCAVGAGYGLGGGTDEQSFVDNRDAVAGGATVIET